MNSLLGVKYLSCALLFLAVYLLALGVDLPRRNQWQRWLDRLQVRMRRETADPDRPESGSRRARRELNLRVLGLAGGFCLGLALAWDPAFPAATLALAGILAAAGFYVPVLIAASRERQRRRALETQLPDALELTANSMRAGLSLVQALEVVAREIPRPLAAELSDVLRDVRLGLAPEDALAKLSGRWKNPDLELFVLAAEVSRRTGGNLAAVAVQIVETVRERVRLQGRIASLTAQGKMSGWVVGLLPLGLLVAMSLLDPELMQGFLRHPLGWMLLAGGVIMEILGAFFIRKIIDIDV